MMTANDELTGDTEGIVRVERLVRQPNRNHKEPYEIPNETG